MVDYLEVGTVVFSPFRRTLTGLLVSSAVGCTDSGREGLVAMDATIEPGGRWVLTHDDTRLSGQARSESEARPHLEDTAALLLRALTAEHQLAEVEKDLLTTNRKLDEVESLLAAAPQNQKPAEAIPAPLCETQPEPKANGESTPAWPLAQLLPFGERISRLRDRKGWSWQQMADAAAKDGFRRHPSTWWSWSACEHAPTQAGSYRGASDWLAQFEADEGVTILPEEF